MNAELKPGEDRAVEQQAWESNGALVTRGQLFYTMPDGTVGALNFTTSP